MEKAFAKITKFNGEYDQKSVEFVVQKLKEQKQKDMEVKDKLRVSLESDGKEFEDTDSLFSNK